MSEGVSLLESIFGKEDIEIKDYVKFKEELFISPRLLLEFTQRLNTIKVSDDRNKNKKIGILYWLAGRIEEAIDILKLQNDNKSKYFYAKSLREIGGLQAAYQIFNALSLENHDEPIFICDKCEVLSLLGQPEEALKILQSYSNKAQELASYHYQIGFAMEMQGLYEKAIESYGNALKIQENYTPALFRMAFRYDMYVMDEKAIEYYERCLQKGVNYSNILINLGILYEDINDYSKAIECYQKVLNSYPNHLRARLYLKDAMASLSMFVDEESEKQKDKQNQILATPISDFELSVRSRNCLNKMRIKTLGDLIKKTEAELLSYKNFGETSLAEIKEILNKKNLRLGMDQKEEKEIGLEVKEVMTTSSKMEVYKKPISQLELSGRSRKCLAGLNVQSIGDLVQRSEADLLSCKNFGQTSLGEIKQKLAEFGVSLRDS